MFAISFAQSVDVLFAVAELTLSLNSERSSAVYIR